LITAKVIENAYQVLAIEFLSAAQAIDALKFSDRLSAVSKNIYNEVRTLVPRFEDDTILYKKLEKVKKHLQSNNPDLIKK
jgi:histidine ammonia-lyase